MSFKLRPSSLLIPFAPSPRLLLWIGGAFVCMALFSCWERDRQAGIVAKDKAQHQAYEVKQAQLRERIAYEARRAEIAEDRADSLAKENRKQEQRVTQAAKRIPRIRVVDSPDSMVSVCFTETQECHPAHREVARVTAELDSLLQHVVVSVIPAFEAERVQWKAALHQQKILTAYEREAKEAAEFRVRQQIITIDALTPGKWKNRFETFKRVSYFLAGVYVGQRAARALAR